VKAATVVKFACLFRRGVVKKGMSAQMKMVFTALLLAGLVTGGCSQEPKSATGHVVKIQLTSAAFADGQPIPVKYTADALDISPPLAWANAPAGTKSFALIADDRDAPAGDWTHWVIYDLPPTAAALAEDTLKVPQLPNGAKQGLNDFKKPGYNGPAPPPGKAHRYIFKLYALDAMTGLAPAVAKTNLLKAMDGHVLGEGQLKGTYQRQQ
jgi:Raf kinase inhibitor-like YbhB/YbcL family protein